MTDFPQEARDGDWIGDAIVRKMRDAAAASLARQVKAGALAYRREDHLAGLIRIGDAPQGQTEEARTRWIIARVRNALRGERARARSGHWSYDLNRHIALKSALKAECERLSSPASSMQSAGTNAGA